ncbi:hypothetical protein RFI_09225, partial [Reticulomyxa filosa]
MSALSSPFRSKPTTKDVFSDASALEQSTEVKPLSPNVGKPSLSNDNDIKLHDQVITTFSFLKHNTYTYIHIYIYIYIYMYICIYVYMYLNGQPQDELSLSDILNNTATELSVRHKSKFQCDFNSDNDDDDDDDNDDDDDDDDNDDSLNINTPNDNKSENKKKMDDMKKEKKKKEEEDTTRGNMSGVSPTATPAFDDKAKSTADWNGNDNNEPLQWSDDIKQSTVAKHKWKQMADCKQAQWSEVNHRLARCGFDTITAQSNDDPLHSIANELLLLQTLSKVLQDYEKMQEETKKTNPPFICGNTNTRRKRKQCRSGTTDAEKDSMTNKASANEKSKKLEKQLSQAKQEIQRKEQEISDLKQKWEAYLKE